MIYDDCCTVQSRLGTPEPSTFKATIKLAAGDALGLRLLRLANLHPHLATFDVENLPGMGEAQKRELLADFNQALGIVLPQ